MASTKIKIGLAAGAAGLVGAVSMPLVIQQQTNRRLLGEIAALRQQGTELPLLREEVQRLTAEAQSLAGQREKERREPARLRGELVATKPRETKTATAAKNTKAGKPRTPADTSEAAKGELVQRDEWRNVGFQAPSLTVQRMAAAVSSCMAARSPGR